MNSEKKPNECNICKKSFFHKSSLSRHKRIHQEGKKTLNIKCKEDGCVETFSIIHNFREHLQNFHKLSEYNEKQELVFGSRTGKKQTFYYYFLIIQFYNY